jgi:type IV pilus assembly protein PilA
MRTELKAKFLQHLAARKNSEKGFTLVELLVVIVIIGILTAIALPAFLNETSKAKQTEGKQNVVSINKAQVAFRAENSGFSSNLDVLAVSSVKANSATANDIGTTVNFTYNLSVNTGADSAMVAVTARDGGLKGYNGAVTRLSNTAGQNVMSTVICEMPSIGTTSPGTPTVAAGAEPVCNATATKKLSI